MTFLNLLLAFALQPPAGQGGFVPLKDLPAADKLPAAPFLVVAYASRAAREPRIHPITTPTSSTAGMKMKWPAVTGRRPAAPIADRACACPLPPWRFAARSTGDRRTAPPTRTRMPR